VGLCSLYHVVSAAVSALVDQVPQQDTAVSCPQCWSELADGKGSAHESETEMVSQGRVPRERRAMVANRSARVDWATAEALAFGALMLHRGVRPPGYPTPQSLADPPLLPADLQPPISEVQMHLILAVETLMS